MGSIGCNRTETETMANSGHWRWVQWAGEDRAKKKNVWQQIRLERKAEVRSSDKQDLTEFALVTVNHQGQPPESAAGQNRTGTKYTRVHSWSFSQTTQYTSLAKDYNKRPSEQLMELQRKAPAVKQWVRDEHLWSKDTLFNVTKMKTCRTCLWSYEAMTKPTDTKGCHGSFHMVWRRGHGGEALSGVCWTQTLLVVPSWESRGEKDSK